MFRGAFHYGPVVTLVGPVWIMGVAPLTAIAEVGFWIVFLKMYTLVAATTGSECGGDDQPQVGQELGAVD